MYEYVYYESKMFVIEDWQYEEYMSIPRDSTNPKVDPYKFSTAMISLFRGSVYVTLTNIDEMFDIGFKRDWEALYNGVNEGIRLFEQEVDRRRNEDNSRNVTLL